MSVIYPLEFVHRSGGLSGSDRIFAGDTEGVNYTLGHFSRKFLEKMESKSGSQAVYIKVPADDGPQGVSTVQN